VRKKTVVGIQGGVGSFNDEAIHDYLLRHPEVELRIEYLDTTPRVLEALDRGEIQYGQFAVYNSVGGLYQESLQAMAAHVFEIIEQYELPIAHALMMRRDASVHGLERIVSHAEVFKQCQGRLASEFPKLVCEVGRGGLTDPASVARALGSGNLPRTVATLSNRRLAEVHDLRVIASDLQDCSSSTSTFLLVASASGRASPGRINYGAE
jgi:prephenate dehydratase